MATQAHKEHFRGVVWPRQQPEQDTNGNYRYVIVGMLITDKPIPDFDYNELVLDGTLNIFDGENGISGNLQRLAKYDPAYPVGDASDVLLNLNDIVGEPMPYATFKLQETVVLGLDNEVVPLNYKSSNGMVCCFELQVDTVLKTMEVQYMHCSDAAAPFLEQVKAKLYQELIDVTEEFDAPYPEELIKRVAQVNVYKG